MVREHYSNQILFHCLSIEKFLPAQMILIGCPFMFCKSNFHSIVTGKSFPHKARLQPKAGLNVFLLPVTPC